MSDNERITITIDQKKFRIRIHKSTLHLLGDPKYLQLLINPDKKRIAIRAVTKDMPNAHTYKVCSQNYNPENSYELYSNRLISMLSDEIQIEDKNCSFRIYGELVPQENAAVFSYENIEVIDTKD